MTEFSIEQLQRDGARCHHVWSALGLLADEEEIAVHDLLASEFGAMAFFSDPAGFARACSEDTGLTLTSDDISTFIAYKNDREFADAIDDVMNSVSLADDPTGFQTSDEVYLYLFGVAK